MATSVIGCATIQLNFNSNTDLTTGNCRTAVELNEKKKPTN